MTALTRIVLLQQKGVEINYHFDKTKRLWVDNIEDTYYRIISKDQCEAHKKLKALLGE